jgi:hypothetical protein
MTVWVWHCVSLWAHGEILHFAFGCVQNDGVGVALRFVITKSPSHQVTKSPSHQVYLVIGEDHAAVALGRVWLVVFVVSLCGGMITGAVLRLRLLRQQHLRTLERRRAGLR